VRYFNRSPRTVLWSISPVLMILIASLELHAQISVSRDDFFAVVNPATLTYSLAPDPSVTSVNIGRTGGPNVYDFSTLLYQPPDLIRNFFVDSIPLLKARYPAGAVTFGTAADTLNNNPVFVFTADTLFQAGNATITDRYRFRHFSPFAPVMPFPLMYGQTFSRSSSYRDTTFDLSWQILSTIETDQPASCVVDGYGTLKIPGQTVACLRIMVDFPKYNEKEVLFITGSGLLLNIDLSGVDVDTGVVNFDGLGTLSTTRPTSVGTSFAATSACSLHPNFPNPFNPGTTINYELASGRSVDLRIFDLCGRQVATLINGYQAAGRHSVTFDGRGLSSGIYVCRLRAGDYQASRKITLVK